MARGFHPEDQGVKQVELATLRLSLDTELSRETLAEVVTNIDKAHPWRFAGIRALLTLGFGDTYREDVNLIAFASRCHIPSDSDMGYPILNPSKRRLGIGWRAQDQVVLMVREAATS
ncbi:MAG: hypothetical protein KBD47_03190 [Candidatus Pacebacteria bacterium]|nr:hypothetical protein [Candidatus Paceibacterota bacterium]